MDTARPDMIPQDLRIEQSLATDAKAAASYFAGIDVALKSLRPPLERSADALKSAREIKTQARQAKERFFRTHVSEIYDSVTANCTKTLRCNVLRTERAGGDESQCGQLPN